MVLEENENADKDLDGVHVLARACRQRGGQPKLSPTKQNQSKRTQKLVKSNCNVGAAVAQRTTSRDSKELFAAQARHGVIKSFSVCWSSRVAMERS